jgi:uncharacterized coiled-coil protein SlyX
MQEKVIEKMALTINALVQELEKFEERIKKLEEMISYEQEEL